MRTIEGIIYEEYYDDEIGDYEWVRMRNELAYQVNYMKNAYTHGLKNEYDAVMNMTMDEKRQKFEYYLEMARAAMRSEHGKECFRLEIDFGRAGLT